MKPKEFIRIWRTQGLKNLAWFGPLLAALLIGIHAMTTASAANLLVSKMHATGTYGWQNEPHAAFTLLFGIMRLDILVALLLALFAWVIFLKPLQREQERIRIRKEMLRLMEEGMR